MIRAEHQRISALLPFLGLLSSGCLLFTDPINTPPTVSIIPPATFERGKDLPFSADARDDDPQTLKYLWGVVPVKCPSDGTLPTTAPLNGNVTPSFTFKVTDLGPYCVFVTVTDAHAATARATMNFAVLDAPPTVKITPVSVVTTAFAADARTPLYSRLRFKIEASDPDLADLGQLPIVSQLTSPAGRTAPPPSCGDTTTDVCFAVDEPGPWVLVATVADPARMPATAKVPIEVAPDQAPCITETIPLLGVSGLVRDADDLDFTVLEVKDDGDPLPAPLDRPSMSSFAWSWRRHGDPNFTRVIVPDLPSFHFPPGVITSGESVDVRVEVRDRRSPQTELFACTNPEKALCDVRPKCNQWVTWTVGVL